MKKVSVKFNKDGKWAVTLEKQIEVKEGEVVNGLPVVFAHIVQDAGRGEIVETPEPEVDEGSEEEKGEDDSANDDVITTSLFSPSELNSLKMPALKELAKKFDLTGNKKEPLINEVLEIQVYDLDYLDSLPDADLLTLAIAKELVTDENEPEDEEELTDEETQSLVNAILESQESED